MTDAAPAHDHDVLVVGSGFAGAVTALRLTEKGYRVCVLEAGYRFADADFPKTSWRLRKYLFAPRLGLRGFQRLHRLGPLVVPAGAGVGGGSLVFANTLYEPGQGFYDDPAWSGVTDWKSELAPHFDQARRMLGSAVNPTTTPTDRVMRSVAEDMGAGGTFRPLPVAVHFGPPQEVDDPYFGGAGPRRSGCRECGECLTGCRYGAKNTVVKNYLHLAENAGAQVRAESTVTSVRPLDGGGYAVQVVRTGAWFARPTTLTAEHVVLAAGALGTQRLLHRMVGDGSLPRTSSRLGSLTRAPSDLLAATASEVGADDYSTGVAATSAFRPDPDTLVQAGRYGKGSNSMGLATTPFVDAVGRGPRWLRWLGAVARDPVAAARFLDVRRWSERTIIVFVVRTGAGTFTVSRKRGGGLTARRDPGALPTVTSPLVADVLRRTAQRMGGAPAGTVPGLGHVPVVLPFVGGCPIGETAETGVVDPYHRLHGHPGLHVVDGSAVTADAGVNPSLTITAQAERAMSLWPNKGEPDPRPEPGQPYRRLAPVRPHAPAVPAHAPAALRTTPDATEATQ
ncbi:GMC family oxidoreductase [Actinosynnema pretiosum subsp. pretiosum]|uniref:Cholesterol oxidase n=1 Tax=Actinosynnema pretiosum subsp. pretiosum TaxID=103721 RepID=A0AA45L7U6_9PSEU|nr:putative cholesterol oxidase [Actinosynnema pretiosum subsp. pretiosum]QUF04926.1 GMC family oxidoreductase [Actinosynnema pretiosum subsp. pretiosum]